MRTNAALQPSNMNLAKGIQRIRRLPDDDLGELWNSIILDERLKTQLVSQAVLNFTIRGKVARTVLPLHGVILLVGPPGTGKTSLALGLAHRVAQSFKGGGSSWWKSNRTR
jgi:SpoVK/Ycf46/Vps4 family AAA+-type ATPase